MRELSPSEMEMISGGEDELRLPTVVVRAPSGGGGGGSFSYGGGTVDRYLDGLGSGWGSIGIGGGGGYSPVSGTTITDVNGNSITIPDFDSNANYAENPGTGLRDAETGTSFDGINFLGEDFHGANGQGGPDGIADQLNDWLDDGTIIVTPPIAGV